MAGDKTPTEQATSAKGIGGAAFVTAGAFFALSLLLLWERNDLSTRLHAAEEKVDAALSAVIPPETVSSAARSIYMVLDDGDHAGTAFVIDQEKGILATAAHVVEDMSVDGAVSGGGISAVINRDSGAPIPIAAIKVHSGYGVFRDLLENYQPIDPTSPVTYVDAIGIEDLPLDVALIYVAPKNVNTGAYTLAPTLPIASLETLNTLKVGEPIASIGFPSDAILGATTEISATPRAERGVIAALVSPIDQALNSDNPMAETLIAHRMAIASGASGGPILNGHGEIIGVTSHSIDSVESNGDAIAQRADALLDMLSPFGEEIALSQRYLPDWRERLSFWPPAKKALPAVALMQATSPIDELSEQGATVSDAIEYFKTFKDKNTDIEFEAVEFEPSGDGFTLFAPDLITSEETDADDSNGKVSFLIGDSDGESLEDIYTAANTPAFTVDDSGSFAKVEFYLPRFENHVLFALNYRPHPSPLCRTRLFYRWRGHDELLAAGPSDFPMFFLPAIDIEEIDDDDEETADVVVQKKSCKDEDNKALIGVVSWEADEPTPDDLQAAYNASRHYAEALEAGGLRAVSARLRKAARCAMAQQHEKAQAGCVEIINAAWPAGINGAEQAGH